MSRIARTAILVALATLAVLLFVLLSGGDEDSNGDDESAAGTAATATAPQPPTFERVELRAGEPVGGVRRLTFDKGDRVRIEVLLDEPQGDVHIHGYEEQKLNPSGRVRFDFPAKLDGIYELEAHGPSGDVVLAEIVVNP